MSFTLREYAVAAVLTHLEDIERDLGSRLPPDVRRELATLIADTVARDEIPSDSRCGDCGSELEGK